MRIEERKRAVSYRDVEPLQTVDNEFCGLFGGTGLIPRKTRIIASVIIIDGLQSQGTDPASRIMDGYSAIVDPRN